MRIISWRRPVLVLALCCLLVTGGAALSWAGDQLDLTGVVKQEAEGFVLHTTDGKSYLVDGEMAEDEINVTVKIQGYLDKDEQGRQVLVIEFLEMVPKS